MFCYFGENPASVFTLKEHDVMAQTRTPVVIKNELPVITLRDYIVTQEHSSKPDREDEREEERRKERAFLSEKEAYPRERDNKKKSSP